MYVCVRVCVCVCAVSPRHIEAAIYIRKAFSLVHFFASCTDFHRHLCKSWRKNIMHGWIFFGGGGGIGGKGMGKKIIHMPEDKCIFSTCLIPCPHFQPLFHLSLLPHFVFLSPATLFLLPLSSSPLSGRLTRNDRAFCHGVWNTLNITCQLRDDNGWQAAECTPAMLDVLSSTHFRLCLNPIIGRLESSFLGWKSMSASLCARGQRC